MLPTFFAFTGLRTEITVLHAKSVVDRTFHDPTQPTPIDFRVVEDFSPVDAVVREAVGVDLVVFGVEERWGLESHLLAGGRNVLPISAIFLLIVRKGTETIVPATKTVESFQQPPVPASTFVTPAN